MKNKILKFLFIISFLPYLFIIINGIFNALAGTIFIFDKIYGFDALLLTIIFTLYTLTLEFPLIPICLIFQICYILKAKVKRFKSINVKKYVKICIAIGLPLIIILTLYSHSFEIEQFIQKINAKQMIKNSEEKICINPNNILYGGIFNIREYESDHVFIDYDNIEVGLLLNLRLS